MHIGDLIEALSKGNGHFTHGINWIESAAEFKSDEVRESFARLVKSRPISHQAPRNRLPQASASSWPKKVTNGKWTAYSSIRPVAPFPGRLFLWPNAPRAGIY
jgi:hypothetical protein